MSGWDENLEVDRTFRNGVQACIEALETGQAQVAADLLRNMKIHLSANTDEIKKRRASAPYVKALSVVRRLAKDERTKEFHGQAYVNGLVKACSILEKEYRKE